MGQVISSHGFGLHIFFPMISMHMYSALVQIVESPFAKSAIILLNSHMDTFYVIYDFGLAIFGLSTVFTHPRTKQVRMRQNGLKQPFSSLRRSQVKIF